jgi:hypothetical protein
MDTVLYLPDVSSSPPPPKLKPQRAEMVEHKTYADAGLEGQVELRPTSEFGSDSRVGERLETAAGVFLWLGLIAGGLCLLGAFASFESADAHPGTMVIIGVGAIVQGIVAWLLFRAGGEIIRLLQQNAETKFTGKIIQRSVSRTYKCSLCNAATKPSEAQCPRCGAEFKP